MGLRHRNGHLSFFLATQHFNSQQSPRPLQQIKTETLPFFVSYEVQLLAHELGAINQTTHSRL